MDNFWAKCLERFEQELSPQQFNTWIKPLSYRSDVHGIQILAPNRFVQQWVKDRFLHRIHVFAEEYMHASVSIDILITDHAAHPPLNGHHTNKAHSALAVSDNPDNSESPESADIIHEIATHATSQASPKSSLKNVKKVKLNNDLSGLNAAFSFDNFVTGKANQLARAAAIQVAENPGLAYNPLFVYGGVGLGKTHLLQAIGNHLKQDHPEAKIRYLHAERYVSDVVKAYEHKSFDEFKRQYHSLDLLLIDDIQFFAKKTRTQEEFFYAFNSLIEAKKQIIITCDTYPKEIADVDERLRTRFSWGLTVAIEPPELEMRVAILLKKALEAKILLHEDVAFFIGKQVRSNVRELEGALNRIVAMARFSGHSIDVSLA
jgi:chromosomal replication initiator protein